MILAWLRHLFVADPATNTRIAAAETAQDRKEGRLPVIHPVVEATTGTRTPPGYHGVGCLMRFEVYRHHHDCTCWCHR